MATERVHYLEENLYQLYLSVLIAEDNMFPLKCERSILVKIKLCPNDRRLIVAKWTERKQKHNRPKLYFQIVYL